MWRCVAVVCFLSHSVVLGSQEHTHIEKSLLKEATCFLKTPSPANDALLTIYCRALCSYIPYIPNILANQPSQNQGSVSPELFWAAPPTHHITVSTTTSEFHHELDWRRNESKPERGDIHSTTGGDL